MDRTLRPLVIPALCCSLLLGAAALASAQGAARPDTAAPAAAKPDPAKALAKADVAKGKQVFATYCQTCHGEKGDGQGPASKTLNPPPRDFTKAQFKFGDQDEDLFDTISNGAAAQKASDGTPGSPLMAPWGSVIPEGDRWALVKYIRTLRK
jgi:mono/diheme cytochrome c family protein